MTTNFKRIRKLDFRADTRKIVDIVNQLVDYTSQTYGPTSLGVKTLTSSDSPYTVIATDELLRIDTTSGNITINLPAIASNDGRELKIKRISAGTNIATIDGNSSETIDGALTYVLHAQYSGITIRADAATEWNILGWI